MLVKLGDVWVDPSSVIIVRKVTSTAVPINLSVINIEVITRENYSFFMEENEDCTTDNFAAIVNEALSPKQSWSEEVSEPEK